MASGWASSCLKYDKAFRLVKATNTKSFRGESNGLQPPALSLQPPQLGGCDCINFVQRLDSAAGLGTLVLTLAEQISEENSTVYTQDISQKSNGVLRLNLLQTTVTE